MSEKSVRFDLEPSPVDRLELRGILDSEVVETDKEFPDHREHFLKITELPEDLSVGSSEDERRLYDITYYLRKEQEPGQRYQIQVRELADSINRSLVFEFEYFDESRERVDFAVSRLLDSVKRIIEDLDDDRYEEFRLSSELYGCDIARLYEEDTTSTIDEEAETIATNNGVLDPDKL